MLYTRAEKKQRVIHTIRKGTIAENSNPYAKTELGETKIKNDVQTWRHSWQITPQYNYKMWGGHRLQYHPRNPSQNPIKRINHTIIIRRRKAWHPRAVNAASHILKSNREIISMLGLYSTCNSSASQCSFSRSPKVDPIACDPSGPVAPNGEHRRHPQAATPGVTRLKILQVSFPSINQLCKPHTDRDHPAPIWWSW